MKLLLFILIFAFSETLRGQSYFIATFNSSISEATTKGGQYGLYWQGTNGIGNNYLGFCLEGSTNINFSVNGTNGPTITQNPVNLRVIYSAGTSNSPFSVPYLFDTNNFTISIATTNSTPIGLFPPTTINVKRQ